MRRGDDAVRKQMLAKRYQRTAAAAGQGAVVPDADEATRQHMQQEATQELIDRQSRSRCWFL